jgi:hypothetical protein
MSEHGFIEWILKTTINELGPVGILVAGLYLIIGKSLKEICAHIEKINLELGDIKNLIQRCADQMCKQ